MTKNDTVRISVWDLPLALVLLTRLPLPHLPRPVFDRQSSAVWAFPLVGLVIGALACAGGWIAFAIDLPVSANAVLVVAILILTTGAMHEDGLADTADGLWGGFDKERRLEIMKDSHIGTYGVLALILSQLLRYGAIAALISAGALWSLLVACIWSRALMPVLMAALPNARQSGLSHGVGRPGALQVGVGLGLAIALCLMLAGYSVLVVLLTACLSVTVLALIAKNKIGGQTGDILGASQQVAELTCLLALVSLI